MLVYTQIARIGGYIPFLAMHQRAGLCHVSDVGHRVDGVVYRDSTRFEADARLDAEVTVLVLPGLVYLWFALATAVLGRTRRGIERAVRRGVAVRKQALGAEYGVYRDVNSCRLR